MNFLGFSSICPRLKTGETNNPEKPMSANKESQENPASSAKDQEGDSLARQKTF